MLMRIENLVGDGIPERFTKKSILIVWEWNKQQKLKICVELGWKQINICNKNVHDFSTCDIYCVNI